MDGCFACDAQTSQEKSANRMFSFFPCDEKQKKRRATLALLLFVVLSLCFDLQKAKINCAGNSLSLSLFFFSPSLD